ncbi:28354_t:CDS:2 [Racocetra persica]|uniref:28354_t:CDS:1 n=1 Tax=Racocetra persica TaxID=160502 RepID=A0ACA9LSD0_9GLOM|nr:28354_t:CDS:2 [Racocetra persica]
MGKVIWSQWARLIALTAGVFETIGGIFGLFYRIFTFEPLSKDFTPIFNPINIIAILCIVFGFIIVAIEMPVFPFKDTFVATSFIPRIILYLIISGVSILNYQNVNPALYLLIATIMYIAAVAGGEGRNRIKQDDSRRKLVV